MYFVLLCAAMTFILSGLFYISVRCRRFAAVRRAWQRSKVMGWVIFAMPFAAFFISACINFYGASVWFLHLIIFFMLFDGLGWAVGKILHGKARCYISGILAFTVTFAYMGLGWFLAHHIFETDYKIITEKEASVRIALIADAHIGATLDGVKFREQIKRIAAAEPDILAVAGDFADDGTKRKDMLTACKAFAEIEPRYGKYYVFGNHDKEVQNGGEFTWEEMCSALEDAGVTVLEDECAKIGDSIYLIGRKDRSEEGGRMTAGELMKGLSGERYTVVLDHQPGDYDAEAEAGMDLVLSGHTHGGHIYPFGCIGILTGENDGTYGHSRRKNTDFIITSGISGWSIPFKTGAVSEFVIIDVGKAG